MIIAIIILLIFITIFSVIVAVRKEMELLVEIDIRNTLKERQRSLNNRYNSQIIELRTEMLKIQQENFRLLELMKYENAPSPTRISKDTIDAVKYAMKKSHPDNGGRQEDFIRFKKCYEELTK